MMYWSERDRSVGNMKPNWRRDALIVLGAAAGMSALFIAKAL